MKALCPDVCKDRVIDIDINLLDELNVKAMILDIDNTLGGYDESSPCEEVVNWFNGLKSAGISAYIVSNNSHKDRAKTYSDSLGVGFTNLACKPLTFGVRRAVKAMGLTKKDIAIVGDQILTDVLCSKLFRVKCILVTSVEKYKKRKNNIGAK